MRPVKRSLSLGGHRTSVTLEEPFWQALREAAAAEGVTVAKIVADIDRRREPGAGLSSAVRIWLLDYHRALSKRREGAV